MILHAWVPQDASGSRMCRKRPPVVFCRHVELTPSLSTWMVLKGRTLCTRTYFRAQGSMGLPLF